MAWTNQILFLVIIRQCGNTGSLQCPYGPSATEMWKRENSRMTTSFLASSSDNLTLAATMVKKKNKTLREEQIGGCWGVSPDWWLVRLR